MARQSPNRPSEEPSAEAASDLEEPAGRTPSADGPSGRDLWEDVRITPVEIAMPGGVGLTLRAYRMSSELNPTETDADADADDPFTVRERAAAARRAEEEDGLDDEFAAMVTEGDADPEGRDRRSGDEPSAEEFAAAEAEAAGTDSTEDEEPEEADEEVPVFLSHRGKLLAFKTPESLVSFIRSGAPHDLAQLDSWTRLAERVQSSDIDPQPEDRYELDLVVENLRGGHDSWDLPLLIAAGEVARDLGYALRLKPVILALSPGSPLDDLDESLRAAESGGMGGFFGRRRLRKIGAQQASLGWRSIIGKISAAVDWRD
ncbi:MAG TPA: DNA primase [Actinoplanes sp.]|nr:DNA primase [Actinoplanes sp.]